jgi:hypothetical protein
MERAMALNMLISDREATILRQFWPEGSPYFKLDGNLLTIPSGKLQQVLRELQKCGAREDVELFSDDWNALMQVAGRLADHLGQKLAKQKREGSMRYAEEAYLPW